jgi:hypothetical protein
LAAALAAFALLFPPPAAAGPETVLLPFRSVHSMLLIDAKVNGDPVILLLDTGANSTILDVKAYGKTLTLPSRPDTRQVGIVGNAVRVRVDLEIARRFLFSQPVAVMNLGDLPQRLGAPFDGLLGQDILRQFHSIRINYRTHVIELEK